MMNNVKIGFLDDGTAIGLGLANCINRLKNSKADSKIVILLTDGENNTGFIDPITASIISKENIYGVQFHPEKSSVQGLEIIKNFINI